MAITVQIRMFCTKALLAWLILVADSKPLSFLEQTPESPASNIGLYRRFLTYYNGMKNVPGKESHIWQPEYDSIPEDISGSTVEEQINLKKRILADFKRASILSDYRR
ncbi:hypothetical protein D915_000357 [Fasciola hepatica]|uniref:Uncharacterized protein n=1 Tax=Fasciola hepatica TaxID=6192 RepID=A0A4E0RRT2_FASHE|nr:hypothetical protein D915_000357 [Fasciola hepatica]